ncbi:hypothetical protein VNO77_14068 [Canavalia gladiata]|uniref:Uncharacterized protein n=1 Tax=Canavalia gladiata TaxID=3824 RepID=A0AAN9QNK1_CANGL
MIAEHPAEGSTCHFATRVFLFGTSTPTLCLEPNANTNYTTNADLLDLPYITTHSDSNHSNSKRAKL